MAGLLKQLQKQRPAAQQSAVILAPPPQPEPNEPEPAPRRDMVTTGVIDVSMIEPKQLLDELFAESAAAGAKTPAVPVSASFTLDEDEIDENPLVPTKVVKRHGTPESQPPARGLFKEEALPSWPKQDRKLTPQAELILPAACDNYCTMLRENPHDSAVSLAKRAVERTIQNMPPETKVGWKDGDLVEKDIVQTADTKGPLQALYEDAAVSEIYIDGFQSIKVTRRGQMIETPFKFQCAAQYRLFIAAMLASAGRELNSSSPIVDCVLPDKWHSRVNAMSPAVMNADEPRICIRIPRAHRISFYDLLQAKVLPATLAAWLAELVAQGEANILVVGPTGSGKTLVTSALTSEISSAERVITVEDVPEIFGPGNLEKLVAAPGGPKGEGAVNLADLLQAAVRRRPHRIVVGDIQDDDARVFLRILEAGYSGSIGCIYADYVVDGLWRFLDRVSANERTPQLSLMRRISRSVHIVIAMRRVEDRPCVMEVAEILPLHGTEFLTLPLVRFDGVVDGKRIWKLMSTESTWLDRVAEKGVALKTGPGLIPLANAAKESPKES